MFEITQGTIAWIYGFVNYKLISLNLPIGYGIGPVRKIKQLHPSIKREGTRHPKSFEWACHPSDCYACGVKTWGQHHYDCPRGAVIDPLAQINREFASAERYMDGEA